MQVGSIYSTLALSVERYLAVVHPFLKYRYIIQTLCFGTHLSLNCRYCYTARHFIIPVVLYSVSFNIPKFFELTTTCPDAAQYSVINQSSYLPYNTSHQIPDLQRYLNRSQQHLGHCKHGDLEVAATDMRSGVGSNNPHFYFALG